MPAPPPPPAVMKLLKNDVEVGTVTFAMASQTGTYDLAGGASVRGRRPARGHRPGPPIPRWPTWRLA